MTKLAIWEPTKGLCVKGRVDLGERKSELAAPDAVVSIIESGYVLPIKSLPPPFVWKNQPSAKLHDDFVQSSIVMCKTCRRGPLFVAHCLLLKMWWVKKRLVLNLRYLTNTCGSRNSNVKN